MFGCGDETTTGNPWDLPPGEICVEYEYGALCETSQNSELGGTDRQPERTIEPDDNNETDDDNGYLPQAIRQDMTVNLNLERRAQTRYFSTPNPKPSASSISSHVGSGSFVQYIGIEDR